MTEGLTEDTNYRTHGLEQTMHDGIILTLLCFYYVKFAALRKLPINLHLVALHGEYIVLANTRVRH